MSQEKERQERIEQARAQLPNEEVLIELADFFSVFGDYSRIQIISLLRNQKEMNVGDIAETLDMSSSAVSHQLKNLRQKDLVRTRRQGKYLFYRLSDNHVEVILDMGLEHLMEDYKKEANS